MAGHRADAVGKLTAPALIASFEGWNDAGEAATGAVNHLSTAWDTKAVGEIDPEDFYDFQVTRPVMEVTDGKTDRLVWPTTRLSLARPAGLAATWSWCTASSRTCAGGASATSWWRPSPS